MALEFAMTVDRYLIIVVRLSLSVYRRLSFVICLSLSVYRYRITSGVRLTEVSDESNDLNGFPEAHFVRKNATQACLAMTVAVVVGEWQWRWVSGRGRR